MLCENDKTLGEQTAELIRAAFAGIWIVTDELEEAQAELDAMARDESWTAARWDLERGLSPSGDQDAPVSDPLSAARHALSIADGQTPVVVALHHFHRFIGSAEVVAALVRAVAEGKRRRGYVVVMAPTCDLPPELQTLFVTIEHRRPSREQLRQIAGEVATEAGEMPEGVELQRLLDAAAGLTRYEAEGAFSLALVRDGKLTPAAVWELKTQAVSKSGMLSLHRGGGTFEQLGGMANLKAFCRRALGRSHNNDDLTARGVLLLSPPGCGKSAFAKALGGEVGRPVLMLDVGSLLGSLVGQSEERTRRALAIADAMSPCVLMIDEVEKALGGSGGGNDSGVSSRLLGTLLTWLSDHRSDVFVVCTANDVSKLPPEFSRAERFDGVFFVDLPSRSQKNDIWAMYLRQFGLPDDSPLPVDEKWTGAEIRSCCRLASLLDLPVRRAADNVVPVAVTASDKVEQLRSWASERCLSAEVSGAYQYRSPSPRRRPTARTDPSVN